MKIIYILTLIFVLKIESNPIQFQRDQIDYTVFSSQNVNSMENSLSKFHEFFLSLHGRVFEEFQAKRNYPIRIYLYSSVRDFQIQTHQQSFTAGFYLAENQSYHFYLTPKTTGQEKTLETLISHELCHAALDSIRQGHNFKLSVLEEGFCYYNYPPLYKSVITQNKKPGSKPDFKTFIKMSSKSIRSTNKKERESAFHSLSSFIAGIQKEKGRKFVLKLLTEEENNAKWESFWKRL